MIHNLCISFYDIICWLAFCGRLPIPIVLHTVLQWGSAKGHTRNPHGPINMNVLTRILIISCIYFIHHLTPFPSIICRLKAYRPMLSVCSPATLNKFLFLFLFLFLCVYVCLSVNSFETTGRIKFIFW